MRYLILLFLVSSVTYGDISPMPQLQQAGENITPKRGKINFVSGCTLSDSVSGKRTNISCGSIASSAATPFKILGDDTHYGYLTIGIGNSSVGLESNGLPAINVGVASSDSTNIVVGQTTGTGITTINGGTLILNVGPNGGGDINCSACSAGGTSAGLIGLYGTVATPWVSLGKTSNVRLMMLGRFNGDFTFDGKGDTTGNFTGGNHTISCDESTGTNSGCTLNIVPGPAHGTNQNGGTLTLNGGAPTGLGTLGGLVLGGSSTNTGTVEIGNASSLTTITGPLKLAGDIIPPPPAGSNQINFRATSGGALIAQVDANTNKGFYAYSANGTTAKLSVDTTVGVQLLYNTSQSVTVDTLGTHVAGALDAGGGSAGKAICWKADGKTLGFCSTVVGATGGCTCN